MSKLGRVNRLAYRDKIKEYNFISETLCMDKPIGNLYTIVSDVISVNVGGICYNVSVLQQYEAAHSGYSSHKAFCISEHFEVQEDVSKMQRDLAIMNKDMCDLGEQQKKLWRDLKECASDTWD